jgi:hypothetical protein
MNMHKIAFVVAVLAAIPFVSQAQPASPAGAAPDVVPALTGIGEPMKIGGREIAIHRQASGATPVSMITYYFHRPLFILRTNPTPISSYPEIVIKEPRVEGGITYLTFGLILSNNDFQNEAKKFVQSNDPDLLAPGNNVNFDNIRVRRWPITRLTVTISRPLGSTDVLLGKSKALQVGSDEISFEIGFDKPNLDRFKNFAPSGDIEFQFQYTFVNVTQLYAASVATASREISRFHRI